MSNLKVKYKTAQVLEENPGENGNELALDKETLDMTSKARKKDITKATIKERRTSYRLGEDICKLHPTKDLVLGLYKKLS